MPRIRAAISIGQPPLALILEEPGRDWTRWDYRLVKGFTIYEDMTNNSGVPIYWDRSERVDFEVGVAYSKSRAVLDRAEEKESQSKTKSYGKSFYPIPRTKDGGPLPTLEEWLEEQAKRKEMESRIQRKPTPFSNAGWEAETP